MLQSFFRSSFVQKRRWLAVVLPAWVLVSFALAQVLTAIILGLLELIGVPFGTINQAVLSTSLSVVVYVLSLAITIGLPWLIRRLRTTSSDLGLQRFPSWLELGITPVAFLVYVFISAILTALAAQFLLFIDFEQAQETGFDQLGQNYEYVLAFLTLVILAPIAEEVLFRGYLFGKLRKHAPVWVAIIVTSLLFAVVHGAWNVGIDVFALSIVLCLLRVWLKSIWAPILLHMLKNGIAFYFLFINPTLLTTLGG
jgi:membrane protease YdiL (CAAX protease family)